MPASYQEAALALAERFAAEGKPNVAYKAVVKVGEEWFTVTVAHWAPGTVSSVAAQSAMIAGEAHA